jgi:hypothetical protein
MQVLTSKIRQLNKLPNSPNTAAVSRDAMQAAAAAEIATRRSGQTKQTNEK